MPKRAQPGCPLRDPEPGAAAMALGGPGNAAGARWGRQGGLGSPNAADEPCGPGGVSTRLRPESAGAGDRFVPKGCENMGMTTTIHNRLCQKHLHGQLRARQRHDRPGIVRRRRDHGDDSGAAGADAGVAEARPLTRRNGRGCGRSKIAPAGWRRRTALARVSGYGGVAVAFRCDHMRHNGMGGGPDVTDGPANGPVLAR